jgi:hypothetical protein
MNKVDNDGNTALHLAVEAGSLQMFCPLLANPQVNLNLPNSRGETPLDITEYKIPEEGLFNGQVYNLWAHFIIKQGQTTDIFAPLISFYLFCFCGIVTDKYATRL